MGSWIAKSLGISAVVALVTGVGSYLFFNIHRELEIQPAYAYRLAVIAFVLSAIISMIYFRTQRNR